MGTNKKLWTVGEVGIELLCEKADLTNALLQELINILRLVHGIGYLEEEDDES